MSRKIALTATIALSLSFCTMAEPVSLIFAGDIMLDDGPGQFISEGGDPLLPFAEILKQADYRIANLESPIATSGAPLASKIYSFRANPRVLPILQGRFDAVSLANNHSGDQGREGLLETLQHLEQSGIAQVGGGRNLAEAHQPLWINRKGLKIAVLAYNEFKPRSFEAGAKTPGIAWSEDSHVISDIRAAKAAGADLIIPFMHWGFEKFDQPSQRQRQFARQMIDEGAALVVGSHPHVTQGAETYRGKPIIYSLGNFVFDGFDYAAGKRGWLLRLKLDKSGVIFWDTLAAEMDKNGTPYPLPGTFTPCGRGGEDVISACQNP